MIGSRIGLAFATSASDITAAILISAQIRPAAMHTLSSSRLARIKAVDIAIMMLQTGMRPNEVYSIRKEDVHPGFIFVPKGKTRFARRNIPLTAEATEVLERRAKEAKGACLFPSRSNPDKPMTITRSHLTVCRKIGLEFRLYDLRHTFGSRAAMAGVDLPTLKELMGHSSITLTMRYVHPTPAHKVEAIHKLRIFNGHNS